MRLICVYDRTRHHHHFVHVYTTIVVLRYFYTPYINISKLLCLRFLSKCNASKLPLIVKIKLLNNLNFAMNKQILSSKVQVCAVRE